MKNYFKYENEEQAREYMKSLVGHKVNVICTGMELEGDAVEFIETEHSFNLVVNHRPVQWGNEFYTKTTAWCRKHDGFGSSKFLAKLD